MSPESSPQSQHPARRPKCPICRKLSVAPGSKSFPFCSDRCKLIDLGRWLDGSYQIEAREIDDEVDEANLPTWEKKSEARKRGWSE